MSKRKNRNLQRKPANQETYDLVLIVCEGEKTEPLYFESLKSIERLSSANIKVTTGKHSDPITIINKAIEEQEKQKHYLPFDKVYCVIDGDVDKNLNQARKIAKDNNINLVISDPCFEYWYLCHFTLHRASIVGTGSKSAGHACVSLLNTHWKKEFKQEYSKNTKNTYPLLLDRLESAIANAQKGLKHAKNDNNFNPSTQVCELVDYLRKLK